MTLGELRAKINAIAIGFDSYQVVIAKDSEGNDFSPMYSLSEEMYEPDSTWSGTLVDPPDEDEEDEEDEDSDEDNEDEEESEDEDEEESEDEEDDEDYNDYEPNAIVFWPVN